MQFALFSLLVLVSLSRADTKGFWWWTWSGISGAPSGTSLSVAFSGWTDPGNAIRDSASVVGKMPGTKYLSLGGGNANGHWDAASLRRITEAVNRGDFKTAGYHGLCYDVEEGDSGLAGAFRDSFAACRRNGLKVLVTVSHSAPYGIGDANALMQSFFSDGNIDILSPQLYTTGNEGSNDYSTTAGVQWESYANTRAAVMPAITKCGLYDDAKHVLGRSGIKVTGFIQWQQSGSCSGDGGSSSSGGNGGNSGCPAGQCMSQWNYCGTGPQYCGQGCKGGPCSGGSPPPPPSSPPPTTGNGGGNSGCPPGQCKNKWDYCGTGNDYCGEGCKGGPCYGSGPQCGAVRCQPGQCCSKWGYCGTGNDYCGNQREDGGVESAPQGLSTGALAGIIVGSIVGAIVLVGFIALGIYKIRLQNTSDTV